MKNGAMDKFAQWILARTQSERMLLAGGCVAGIYYGLIQGLDPLVEKYRKEMNRLTLSQQRQLTILERELREVSSADVSQATERVKREYEDLTLKVAQEEQLLRKIRSGLVSAGQMTEVLSHMLDLHRGLALREIKNFPPEAMVPEQTEAKAGGTAEKGTVAKTAAASKAPANAKDAGKAKPSAKEVPAVESPSSGFFRHRIRLTLQGTFMDILRYLHNVEQLPWKIYWEQAALESSDYPLTEMTVEFYTVSDDMAWFKVN